jgi:D-tyrosyl-tRNA(Tyr) deacylase
VRAVVQRVTQASVDVDGKTVGKIGKGLMALIGSIRDDTSKDAQYIATKLLGLRIFGDENGKMNLDVSQVGGSILVVSQFTLSGDARKGKRPDFFMSGDPQEAQALIAEIVEQINKAGVPVESGIFAAHMQVSLTNDGPVTILLDSRRQF